MRFLLILAALLCTPEIIVYAEIQQDVVERDTIGGTGGGGGGDLSTTDIDTFSELDAIVTDEGLVNLNDPQILLNKVIDGNSNTVKLLRDATDCTTYTGAVDGQYCWEQDDDLLYVCETANVCDTAGEWDAVATTGGDITAVGNCIAGNCAIEGGTDIFPFVYEGTANNFETTFSVTDPTADRAVTWPDAGGEPSLLGQTISDSEVDDNITVTGVELTANKNAANGYAGLNGSIKLTAAQGQEVWSLADLTGVGGTTGTGTNVCLDTSPTFVTSALSPVWKSTNADSADNSVGIALGNNESVCWELATPGTDKCLKSNTSNNLDWDGNPVVTSATDDDTPESGDFGNLTDAQLPSSMANKTFTGTTTVSQRFDIAGTISPAQITADQTDYNPAGLSTASVLRITSDADGRIINSLAGGSDGRVLLIHNIGSFYIWLENDDGATGTASMRFDVAPDNVDFVLYPRRSVLIQYDGTTSRWRILSPVARYGQGIAPDDTIKFRYDVTLAQNPAFGAKECIFSSETGSGGFICEGTGAANSLEQGYYFPASDGNDTTNYFALGDSSGKALDGDNASGFFISGQIEAARGGTGQDSSAWAGWVKAVSGTWSAAGIPESCEVSMDAPVTTDELEFCEKPMAVTATAVRCECYGTCTTVPTIKVCKGEDLADDTCTTNLLDSTETTTLSCSTAGGSDTALNSTALSANQGASIIIANSPSSDVNRVRIVLEYTQP